MAYHFRNLVFEGGGVKGLAYIGALEVLESKGILADIQRFGGTSAGAINAALLALGYTRKQQKDILWELNFRKFQDGFGFFNNLLRVFQRYGWYKGDFFKKWMGDLIADKLGNRKATFKDLKDKGYPELYVYGTNLCTHFGEVFSIEHTPNMRIADAVRISMSIPIYFAAVPRPKDNVYVDGGCLNNYPIKLFDREKYIAPDQLATMGHLPDYYKTINKSFLKKYPDHSPYIYNKQTLGFRIDSSEEIAAFRYDEKHTYEVKKFSQYVQALVVTIMNCQANEHLHSDDWHRTVYIDSKGISTTKFDLDVDDKNTLLDSGRTYTKKYFDEWYDTTKEKISNRP
jgi:NTE family protein